MAQEESIVLGMLPVSKRERTRRGIFEMIQQKHLTRWEAARQLQLSEQRTRRLYQAWLHWEGGFHLAICTVGPIEWRFWRVAFLAW